MLKHNSVYQQGSDVLLFAVKLQIQALQVFKFGALLKFILSAIV